MHPFSWSGKYCDTCSDKIASTLLKEVNASTDIQADSELVFESTWQYQEHLPVTIHEEKLFRQKSRYNAV